MTIEAALDRLKTLADSCTGVKFAEVEPPSFSVYPAVTIFEADGEFMIEGNAQIREIHNIVVQYHNAPAIRENSGEDTREFVREFISKLTNDPTLNSTISAIIANEETRPKFNFGWITYGKRVSYGVQFELPVKLRRAST